MLLFLLETATEQQCVFVNGAISSSNWQFLLLVYIWSNTYTAATFPYQSRFSSDAFVWKGMYHVTPLSSSLKEVVCSWWCRDYFKVNYCTVVLVLFYVFVPCRLVIAPSKTKETAILEFVWYCSVLTIFISFIMWYEHMPTS